MELVPCRECQRHIAITERACPFCGVTLGASMPRRLIRRGGSVSRAAVFVSAAACYTSAPHPQQQQQRLDEQQHVDDQQQQQQHDDVQQQAQGDTSPPPDTTFAKPPPGGTTATNPAAAPATLSGRVLDSNGRSPLAGVHVFLTSGVGGKYTTLTDAKGRYTFKDVPAGDYRLDTDQRSDNPHAPPPPPQPITLAAGQTMTKDIYVYTYIPDTSGPCCKPYGAPPARRRVV